jgi:Mg-chelatase subunit ChlD
MNPESSLTPGEELEIRITALLMGELSPEESTALRGQLTSNAELQALHTRLARAHDLLRAATPLCETIDTAAPVRLSSDRRERLLQQFKSTAQPQPKVIPINRPRWTWLAPLSWAASFTLVLGFLAWQLAQSKRPMASLAFYDSETAGAVAPEGKPAHYRFFAEEAPAERDRYRSTDLSGVAGDQLASTSDTRFDVARGERSKIATAPVPRPETATAASPVDSDVKLYAGVGGIDGFATTPPASTAPLQPADTATQTWAAQAGTIRTLDRNSKSELAAEVASAAPAPATPALAFTDPTPVQQSPTNEFESLRLLTDSESKGRVATKGAPHHVNDSDGDAKGTKYALDPAKPKTATAAEGMFWDTPTAGQPASPALPSSGLVANNPQPMVANEPAAERKPASESQVGLAESNRPLTARSKETRQVAEVEDSNAKLAATEKALEELKKSIPSGADMANLPQVLAQLQAGKAKAETELAEAKAVQESLKARADEATAMAEQKERMIQQYKSKDVVQGLDYAEDQFWNKQSADKKDDVVEPYSVSEPLTTAGRVITPPAPDAPTPGNVPVLGTAFRRSQQGQAGGAQAASGGLPVQPMQPAEVDNLRRFGGIAGAKPRTEDLGAQPIPPSGPAGANPVTSGNRSGSLAINGNAIDALMFGIPDPQSNAAVNFSSQLADTNGRVATDPATDFGTMDGIVVLDEFRDKEVAGGVPYFRGRGIEETGRSYFGNEAAQAKDGSVKAGEEFVLGETDDFTDSHQLALGMKNLEDSVSKRETAGLTFAESDGRAIQLERLEIKRSEAARGFTTYGREVNSTTPTDAWYFKQDGSLAKLGKVPQTNAPAQQSAKESPESVEDKTVALSKTVDAPVAAPKTPAPIPQPEISTSANAFSTFSLNVSDVSFKLAAASLEQGKMPDPGTIRSEEFINAFDYRDPEPTAGAPLTFATERARYPFAQNRDLLRLSIKTAAVGRQPGRPLNLVLLVDNSGSMERADRVRILRESLRILAAQLQPQDKLSIITFSRSPRLWIDGVSGDQAAQAVTRVSEITPQGGTNLSTALDLAYETARKHYQVANVNRVVMLTDGAANLGDVNPAALKQKVETQRKQGIALDCFGIGWEGFNDDLLEQLSRNGDGRYGFINSPDAAASEFAGQLAGALRVAASDVKVQVEFNPKRVTAYRQVGYAKHQLTKEQFRDNTVDAAEIGAAESGNALYVVDVNPRGEGDLATVRARFKVPGTSDYREHEWTVPFSPSVPALEQATPGIRLAATASAFSEMLANSPYATEVTPDRLLGIINGVPQTFGTDPRPQKLEWMIRQAKSLSGR